jgi:cob(I)alamin adenosyltransferase
MAEDSALGRIHVITGPGKGKTTAAFGMALRAAGHGFRVCIVQFLKTSETTGEVIAARDVKGIQIKQFGTGSFVDFKHITDVDRSCAGKALAFTSSLMEKGDCDMVILDEVNTAAHFGLVNPSEVAKIISARAKGVEVVLTGRNAPDEFVDMADYVSAIKVEKHPYDAGLKARKGIEW